jgi:hypothetical protein
VMGNSFHWFYSAVINFVQLIHKLFRQPAIFCQLRLFKFVLFFGSGWPHC